MPPGLGEEPHRNDDATLNHAPSPGSVAATASLTEQCAQVHARVHAFLDAPPRTKLLEQVQRQARISLGVIAAALDRYSLDGLSISYNGGKDCLVLLVLYLAALHTHSAGAADHARGGGGDSSSNHDNEASAANDVATTAAASGGPAALPRALPAVYIEPANPFPAVTGFVAESARVYHLALRQYGAAMREAFAAYLAERPQVAAIFVGTRRTDPHGGVLTHFDPTDRGWPAFTRVHPVIDWHYAEIWAFIRELRLDYCLLYDRGYTSLGGTTDTHPNPALAVPGRAAGAEPQYRPAYELVEDDEERLGRDA